MFDIKCLVWLLQHYVAHTVYKCTKLCYNCLSKGFLENQKVFTCWKNLPYKSSLSQEKVQSWEIFTSF